MKNLFKLKKDGKTVGYLMIENGKVWIRDTEHIWRIYGHQFYKNLIFDEACPYVCDDKNEQPVFEGDRFKAETYMITGGEDDYVFCVWRMTWKYMQWYAEIIKKPCGNGVADINLEYNKTIELIKDDEK